jgi:hypothetical protein
MRGWRQQRRPSRSALRAGRVIPLGELRRRSRNCARRSPLLASADSMTARSSARRRLLLSCVDSEEDPGGDQPPRRHPHAHRHGRRRVRHDRRAGRHAGSPVRRRAHPTCASTRAPDGADPGLRGSLPPARPCSRSAAMRRLCATSRLASAARRRGCPSVVTCGELDGAELEVRPSAGA